ncbi:hypothetical protein ACFXP7_03725 [Microbacterium sp. P06]|uniref:hypothetical protein n=1 Tax=unclassified Microbacterium TaxID=2609290 RepID=UPI003746DD6C
MGEVINLDGDVAVHNASNLHQTAAELPSTTVISRVHGNRTEPAAEFFTTRLEDASGTLGASIENLRAFVALNADALAHAVQALRDTDRMSADAADQATAMIDDMATSPTGSAPQKPSGSDVESQTRNAFGSR